MSMLRRHPRLALLALALGVLGAATAAAFLWSQYHLDAARHALERYAFDEAQHHLDLCLKVRPRSAAVHLLAAQTARRRDAYPEADRHLADCIRLGGMTEATALERSLLTAQRGDFEGLEASLRARTRPEDPEAVLVLEAMAKGFVNCCRETHALVCLNILLERQPRHPQALRMRARAWENRARKGETERDQDALRDYEKAVELDPCFEARLGLAGVLYRVGRPWDALCEYERLPALGQAPAELLLGLARCRYVLHEVDEARRLLDELLAQQPPHLTHSPPVGEGRVREEALLERGRLALHEGQLDQAETWLRQAAESAPRHDREAQRVLYQCLQAAGKTEAARRCLDELAQREAEVVHLERLTLQSNREPNNVALRYEVAMGLMQLGRERDGVAALMLVLDQEPQYGPARAALADYYERTGQPGRAARLRRAGFQSAGANPSAR